MTEKENQKNMEQCSKFISCDIPRCPLDLWAFDRVQLSEDKKCPNWKYAGIRVSKKDREGHIMPSLKDRVSSIGEHRKQRAEMA